MEFERTMKSPKSRDMSTNGKIRVPSWSTYKTFWTLDKVGLLGLIITLICFHIVTIIRYRH